MRVKDEAQAPGRRGAAEKCPHKCFPWYKQRRDVPGTGSNLCPPSRRQGCHAVTPTSLGVRAVGGKRGNDEWALWKSFWGNLRHPSKGHAVTRVQLKMGWPSVSVGELWCATVDARRRSGEGGSPVSREPQLRDCREWAGWDGSRGDSIPADQSLCFVWLSTSTGTALPPLGASRLLTVAHAHTSALFFFRLNVLSFFHYFNVVALNHCCGWLTWYSLVGSIEEPQTTYLSVEWMIPPRKAAVYDPLPAWPLTPLWCAVTHCISAHTYWASFMCILCARY